MNYFIKTSEGKYRTTAGNFVYPKDLRIDEHFQYFSSRNECDQFIKKSGIIRAESWGMAAHKTFAE